MSVQSQYGAVEAEAPAATTPRRGKAVMLALYLCVGGAFFAVAGPGASPRLRGTQLDSYWTKKGKCTQVWECDDPPAASSTPTDPGVVNYFPTVAKQANTDCGGGESVGVNCAGGTPLSTEDKISGEGETVGDVPVSSATTVEGANTGTATTVKCPTECPLMLRRLQACPQPQEGYQYGEAPKDECGCTTGCPPIVKASATKKRNTVQEKGGR